MTKKQAKSIVQSINMVLIFTGLSIIFSMNLNFYYLFAVLVISVLISQILDYSYRYRIIIKLKHLRNRTMEHKIRLPLKKPLLTKKVLPLKYQKRSIIYLDPKRKYLLYH
jgi:ABC-type multidrug transport system permease subunit